MQFDALAIEGGLLPPEWLAKVAALSAHAQTPEDYGVPKGLQLRDEITRYWRIAEPLHAEFATSRQHATDGGMSAARTFMRRLLTQVFGFDDLTDGGMRAAHGRTFEVTFEAGDGRVPVVVAAAGELLDATAQRHGEGGRRRSAWGALQEYLNASDDVLWGIATNGARLRIGRDNTSLTRPAWIEADLDRIFAEDRFADFSVLWLVLHASRFGSAHGPASECPLERWRDDAREEGAIAGAELRNGVEAALRALGQGFVAHPSNTVLRQALASGELKPGEYYNQLLRLVYRMIFLLTIEERAILHGEDVSEGTRDLYATGYGMRRLRERAVRRSQYDRHADLWASLKPVFAGLGRSGGEAALGLPELGGLFAPAQCPHLDVSVLGNRTLLDAVFRLAWLRRPPGLARVNWKDMGPEELGSVYESLLELVPVIGDDGRSFEFAGAAESAGNQRKLTGSYYTPDSLVQQLLDTALEPVIDARLAAEPQDPERALLGISVIDPACGSGHFLLAAARRLASRLAEVRTGGTPGAHEYRLALRDVVTHCIHGVDRNPMALELARMSLWLETYTPDRALGFVDHHLVLGDALLGMLELGALKDGIPDAAFKALTGDDKAVAKTLTKVNRAARKQLEKRRKGPELELSLGADTMGEAFAKLDALGDDRLEGVESKRERYEELRAQAEQSAAALAADLFLGAFLMPKRLAPGEKALTEAAAVERFPTTGTLLMALDGTLRPDHSVAKAARQVCDAGSVLHWPIAFPQVLARGGFDVVLGNPPWERLKLQEQEFFGLRDRNIATAKNKAERAQRIKRLALGAAETAERRLYEAFVDAKREAEASSVFCHSKARYPLTGVGDVNTYALFAETAYRLAPNGRVGLVLPIGIVADDTTKTFFGALVSQRRLAAVVGCHEIRRWFPGTDDRNPFVLLTIGEAPLADLVFYCTNAVEFRDTRRRFQLSADEFQLINPNTLTCPIFRSRADAELTKKIYRNVPVLIDETKPPEEGNPWGVSFMTMFHMSNDSGLFLDAPGEDTLPLYEAKMMHQFDHRWATYESTPDGGVTSRNVTELEKADPRFTVRPRYWVEASAVRRRAARVPKSILDAQQFGDEQIALRAVGEWLAGYFLNRGDVERGNRLITSWLGERLDVAHGRWLGAQEMERQYPLTAGDVEKVQGCSTAHEMISALVDATARRWFIGWRRICRATDDRTLISGPIPFAGVGDSLFLWSLTVHPQETAAFIAISCSIVLDYVVRQKQGGTNLSFYYMRQLPILPPTILSATSLEFIVPRVLELVYTAEDMRPWARDLRHSRPPFAWDAHRRAVIRSELDAYVARLYGLTRDELRYILDPEDIMGPHYPSETFRVLKANELRQFGEYRTRRLVLDAWDRLSLTYETVQWPAPVHAGQHSSVEASLPRLQPSAVAGRSGWSRDVLRLPARTPILDADTDHYFIIFALLHAASGSLARVDLARAFTLWSHPALLARMAPLALKHVAEQWANRVSARGFTDGTLAAAIVDLGERLGVRQITDRETGRSMIEATEFTVAETDIPEWFRFEARLVLAVLDQLGTGQRSEVEAVVSGEDRALLQAG